VLVVDLASSDKYTAEWQVALTTIQLGSDRLKDNYVNLNPKDFASFPVVIDEDGKIVCFSALQLAPDRWSATIGRVSTRMWIHPEYRFTSMTKFSGGAKFLNTTYCLPLQLAVAYRIGLDCVFISREENLKGFQEYLKLIKINCNEEFTLWENKFNVCGIQNPVPESCKQWVATLPLTDKGQAAFSAAMMQYQLL